MLSQPFLFTASPENKKSVRDLFNKLARTIAKEVGVEEKNCTCVVRKFFNRNSKPKMMTAYRQFMHEQTSDIKEMTSSFTEFNQEKTKRWSAIKDDKDQFAEYERRAQVFNDEHGLSKKTKKRPLTGYMLFSNDMRPKIREEDESLVLSEVSKRIGALWNELSTDDKQIWNQKSKDLASSKTEETPVEAPMETPKPKKATKSKAKKSRKTKA